MRQRSELLHQNHYSFPMKKFIVISLMFLAMCTYAIVQASHFQDEVKITVTADKKTTFDMFDGSQGVLKGLTTPYEIKFSRTDSHFIFKSLKPKTNLKIKVELNNKETLAADWPITVLVITNSTCTTFGM